jgi:hypothetical protein
MGRKYGLLAYGKYSYDLWPAWYPIPPYPEPAPPGDIWVPIPATPSFPPALDIWGSAISPQAEIWVPTAPVVGAWGSVVSPQSEMWVPAILPPSFGVGNG